MYAVGIKPIATYRELELTKLAGSVHDGLTCYIIQYTIRGTAASKWYLFTHLQGWLSTIFPLAKASVSSHKIYPCLLIFYICKPLRSHILHGIYLA